MNETEFLVLSTRKTVNILARICVFFSYFKICLHGHPVFVICYPISSFFSPFIWAFSHNFFSRIFPNEFPPKPEYIKMYASLIYGESKTTIPNYEVVPGDNAGQCFFPSFCYCCFCSLFRLVFGIQKFMAVNFVWDNEVRDISISKCFSSCYVDSILKSQNCHKLCYVNNRAHTKHCLWIIDNKRKKIGMQSNFNVSQSTTKIMQLSRNLKLTYNGE